MITNVEREKYNRDGYLLISNVLTAEQVTRLRAFLRPMFESPRGSFDNHHRLADVFVNYPEMHWLCFHEPTLNILRGSNKTA
jgi:hypothetical protein